MLRRRPTRSGLLIAAGTATLLVGGGLVLWPWYEAAEWRASPERQQAERNVQAPQPIWITPSADDSQARAHAQPAPGTTPQPTAAIGAASGAQAAPAPAASAAGDQSTLPGRGTSTATAGPADASSTEPTVVAATPTLGPSDLDLATSDFRFVDPPEPGAAAQLTLSIGNPTDQAARQISVVLPDDWLGGYAVQVTEPPTSDGTPARGDRVPGGLRLTFDGPTAQSELTLKVSFKSTAEVIDSPSVSVFDADGRTVGTAHPPTQAPPPRPGPVYGIAIPHLNLTTGVVQVDWEPPLFVVGQIRASAHVSEGNSVLVGHVRGAAGYNVFDHLDQLAVGDTIVATSRGLPYQFVVDQTQVLPEDDTSPTQPTSTARLTLMTCAGNWNPITRDYSDRLWVIAEPPDTAAATIAARKAATPTPTPQLNTAQISPRGGLGNTDTDLATAFGPPHGESAAKLAVYPGQAQRLEQRAELTDVPSSPQPRALLVAAIAPPTSPLAFQDAVQLSRSLLPKDTQPRDAGPEGNPRFIVERFTSAALATLVPPEWFAERQGQPGDFLVVYARRPDGRVAYVALGIGDDSDAVMAALADVQRP